MERDEAINAVSGAVAGLVTAVFVCPLDVLKTRLQVTKASSTTISGGIRAIVANEGVAGMYKGLGPTLLALLPNWAVYFVVYDSLKRRLGAVHASGNGSRGGGTGPLTHMAAAAGAGVTTILATNPLWVVKTRMQCHGMVTAAVVGVSDSAGVATAPLAAAAAGTAATATGSTGALHESGGAAVQTTVGRSVATEPTSTSHPLPSRVHPHPASQSPGSQNVVDGLHQKPHLQQQQQVNSSIANRCTSSTGTSTSSSSRARPGPSAPRVTVANGASAALAPYLQRPAYRSTAEALLRIAREEGLRGLYSGLAPSMAGIAHVAIQFPLYEYAKQAVAIHKAGQQAQEHFEATGEELDAVIAAPATDSLTVPELVATSAFAKVVASTVTYPHEVVRSYMHLSGSGPLSGLREAITAVWREDGPRGFYRGCAANLMRTTPAAAMTFTTFELVSRTLRETL